LNATRDGVLVCKLINRAVPGTIDERVLNHQPTTVEEIEQNNLLALNSAKAIGCRVQSITANGLTTNAQDALEFMYAFIA
jgi:hypothetical protein